MKHLVVLLGFSLLSVFVFAQSSLPTLAAGSIERIESFESQFVAPRIVDIWLPNNYAEGEKHAVLYMHDGRMLFDSTISWNKQEWQIDESMQRLIDEEKIPPTIVVAVANGGTLRHSEYFPQKPFESLPQNFQDSLINEASRHGGVDLFAEPVQSDKYLRFIVEELKPYIDGNFNVHTDQQHTFVAGSSMGGLISMYAICEYPNVFGGAICLSTQWPGTFSLDNNPIPQAFVNYLKDNYPDPKTHKIAFDVGTISLDEMYLPTQLQVDHVMRQAGYEDDQNYFSIIVAKPGINSHDERSWAARFPGPAAFVMQN